MSVVFIVASEEQLTSGIPWCKAMAENSGTSIHTMVVGTDSKVLLEHARSKLADAMDLPKGQLVVEAVDPDVEVLIAKLKESGGCMLAMVYGEDAKAKQQELFERSSLPTFWLQASGPPPVAATRLFAASSRSSDATASASERLFGFAPAAVLADPFEDPDESVSDVVQRMLEAMEASANQPGDLVLIGIDGATRQNPVYTAGLKLLDNNSCTSLALVRTGESFQGSLKAKIKDWSASVAPPMQREQRSELAQDLESGSKPSLEFLGLISASSMLAAFGLLQDSAAVVIGAMLIAPLMTPIVGAGLALTHGNRPLFRWSIKAILIGFLGALTSSALFGLLARLLATYTQPTGEMMARCGPSPLDFCVGLVGGMAASYARTRTHLSSALAGAAIAAALVPPIATAGLNLAFGWWWEMPATVKPQDAGKSPVIGPLLLVSVNVLTIMVGSSFVLWARGMRADRTLSAKDRWAPRVVIVLVLTILLALVVVYYRSLAW